MWCKFCMIHTIYTVSVHNLNDYHFLAPFTLLIQAHLNIMNTLKIEENELH